MGNYRWKCLDCESGHESQLAIAATSGATWHNTMTGHDVVLIDPDGTTWEQAEVGDWSVMC